MALDLQELLMLNPNKNLLIGPYHKMLVPQNPLLHKMKIQLIINHKHLISSWCVSMWAVKQTGHDNTEIIARNCQNSSKLLLQEIMDPDCDNWNVDIWA